MRSREHTTSNKETEPTNNQANKETREHASNHRNKKTNKQTHNDKHNQTNNTHGTSGRPLLTAATLADQANKQASKQLFDSKSEIYVKY